MKKKRLPEVELVEEKPEYMDLGRRRTSGFLELWIGRDKFNMEPRVNLHDMIASAYLQGVRDAYTALDRRKMLNEAL